MFDVAIKSQQTELGRHIGIPATTVRMESRLIGFGTHPKDGWSMPLSVRVAMEICIWSLALPLCTVPLLLHQSILALEPVHHGLKPCAN